MLITIALNVASALLGTSCCVYISGMQLAVDEADVVFYLFYHVLGDVGRLYETARGAAETSPAWSAGAFDC
ncbi:hypothetical protein GWK36_06100 [Caldichromatium japonicum]|uniref:Uncharacterized protein n=1 Tax=Caldichromatium japonicum TaxID=2699430 RepID=A0A6G7VCM8_9GAMM|nr:hypothetical protein [Caldichromatium japonicum]QIK37626.1 hypothetical protein GWK36_06100 [Caldichromatium japonicum]